MGNGNSAFAAHRDTLFRPLKFVRVGDEVDFRTRRGTLRYRVTRTMIVNPEDMWVLGAAGRPRLTLITCYPFTWIGHASQRFIVQADRIVVLPDAKTASP